MRTRLGWILIPALALACMAGCGKGEEGKASAVHDTGEELLGEPGAELAVVGGKAIRLSEVDLVALFWSQSNSPEAQGAGSRKELQMRALDHLIDQLVLAQEAERQSVAVDDSLIGQMISQWTAQFPSEVERDKSLAARSMTFEEVREKFRQDVLVQGLVEKLIQDTLRVDDGAARAFYDQNPQHFDQTAVRARHVLFMVPPGAPPESLAVAEAQAEEVRRQALAGADFEELAGRYSDCPSKERGGDLGFFRRGEMIPAFSDVAFATQPGTIPEVVHSEYGFHVIKVEERRDEGLRPFEEVQPAIQRYLYQQELQQAVDVLADRLREKAKIKMKVPA